MVLTHAANKFYDPAISFSHEGTGMGNRMWMIRGDGGKLYDDFRDKQIVGIGWSQAGSISQTRPVPSPVTRLIPGGRSL